MLKYKVGDYMFSLKKLINYKKDKQEFLVYERTIRNLYKTLIEFRKWTTEITFASMIELEECGDLMDRITANIDIYTDNKFSLPSTMIGLRKSLSTIGEGMALFIDTTYKNLDKNSEIDSKELVCMMMHSFDLLMAGSRMMMHSLTFEKHQLDYDVDIIARHYKNNKKNSDKIKFSVEFIQPSKISGRGQKEDNDVTAK